MKSNLAEKAFSFATALFLLLTVIKTANALNISYYPTIHRATLTQTIQISLAGSQEWDSMLLFSLSLIISFYTIKTLFKEHRLWETSFGVGLILAAVISSVFKSVGMFEVFAVLSGLTCLILLLGSPRRDLGKFAGSTARSLLLVLIALMAAALARWVTYPFYPTEMYQDWTWNFARAEMQLFYLPSIAGPPLMLLVLLAWPVRPIAESYVKSLRSIFPRLAKRKSPTSTALEREEKQVQRPKPQGKKTSLVNPKLILVAAVALITALTLYPYHPNINPENRFVGVDLMYYNSWLKEMIGRPPEGAAAYAFQELQGGSRPLHMLILYWVQLATGISTETIVKAQLTLLAPLFAIAVYYFTLAGTKEKSIASLAALIAATSYNITVGMYAAFASNLLALALSYIVLAVYLKNLDEQLDARNLLAVIILTVSVLFTYVWAWVGLLAILLVHEVITTARSREISKSRIRRLAAILSVNLAADLAKSYLFQSLAGGVAGEALAVGSLSPLNVVKLWDNLIFAFRYYVGGYYTNIPLLILAVIGALYCLKKNTPWSNILVAWALSAAIPTIAGNFSLDSHIFFSLPIPILAAAAIETVSNRIPQSIFRPLASFLLLINANYSFRSIANLV